MSDVQRHKMLRSRQPSFLIGEDSPGETLESAAENAADAKKAWLEAALEDGTAIPDPAPVKE